MELAAPNAMAARPSTRHQAPRIDLWKVSGQVAVVRTLLRSFGGGLAGAPCKVLALFECLQFGTFKEGVDYAMQVPYMSFCVIRLQHGLDSDKGLYCKQSVSFP